MVEYKIRVGILTGNTGREQHMAGKGNLLRDIYNE